MSPARAPLGERRARELNADPLVQFIEDLQSLVGPDAFVVVVDLVDLPPVRHGFGDRLDTLDDEFAVQFAELALAQQFTRVLNPWVRGRADEHSGSAPLGERSGSGAGCGQTQE